MAEPIRIPPNRVIKDFQKVWVGPPVDEAILDVEGIEALFVDEENAPPVYAVLLQFTPEDINALVENELQMWFIQITNSMVPFSFRHVSEFPYEEPT